MTRKPTLTETQMCIIRENLELFPAEILKLPEFADATITRDTVRNYQRRIKREIAPAEEIDLATQLQRYIDMHGLPSQFHGHGGVTGFITYLEGQRNLRADSATNP